MHMRYLMALLLVVEKCVHRQGHAFQPLGVGKSTTEPVSSFFCMMTNVYSEYSLIHDDICATS
jgi:hypothetical protein